MSTLTTPEDAQGILVTEWVNFEQFPEQVIGPRERQVKKRGGHDRRKLKGAGGEEKNSRTVVH